MILAHFLTCIRPQCWLGRSDPASRTRGRYRSSRWRCWEEGCRAHHASPAPRSSQTCGMCTLSTWGNQVCTLCLYHCPSDDQGLRVIISEQRGLGTMWTQNGGAGFQAIRAIGLYNRTGDRKWPLWCESRCYSDTVETGDTNGRHLLPIHGSGGAGMTRVKLKPSQGCYYLMKSKARFVVCWEVKSCVWPLPKLAHFSC